MLFIFISSFVFYVALYIRSGFRIPQTDFLGTFFGSIKYIYYLWKSLNHAPMDDIQISRLEI